VFLQVLLAGDGVHDGFAGGGYYWLGGLNLWHVLLYDVVVIIVVVVVVIVVVAFKTTILA
jgi:hypothetical protein